MSTDNATVEIKATRTRVTRLDVMAERLRAELQGVNEALAVAKSEAEYAAQNPALGVDLAAGGDHEDGDQS